MGVGVGVGEAEAGVERDRRGVVGLDVEVHLVDAALGEVVQPGERERLPRPRPCPSGAMPEHVDLAERGRMHLGPVEPEHRAGVVAATSSSSGSNHGSAIRAARSAESIAPCSGWVVERRGVDPEELVAVAVAVAADRDPSAGSCGRGAGARSAAASPRGRAPARSRAARPARPLRGGCRATRRSAARVSRQHVAEQPAGVPLPSGVGPHRHAQRPVEHEGEAVVARGQVDGMAVGLAQRQPGGLVERLGAVGLRAAAEIASTAPGRSPRHASDALGGGGSARSLAGSTKR